MHFAGVDGYVKKDCDLQEIVEAVRETHCGRKFFCSQILETIKKEGINLESLDVVEPDCAGISLSKRELEVILLIAGRLHRTPRFREAVRESAYRDHSPS